MGVVIYYRPKSLVEFEEKALRKVALLSRFGVQLPELLSITALETNDNPVLPAAQGIVRLMEAMESALTSLEICAPDLMRAMIEGETERIECESDQSQWRVVFEARVRSQIVFLRDLQFEDCNTDVVRLPIKKRATG